MLAVVAFVAATTVKADDDSQPWGEVVVARKAKKPADPYSDYLKNLKPMRFVLVKSAASDCGDDCPQWIAAEGDIVQGTAARFRKFMKGLGKRRLPLLIHSGGGSVEDAIAMGQLIRARKLDVAVARTEFTPCSGASKGCKASPPADGTIGAPVSHAAYCASSCAFVLAAGVNRYVGAGAIVGIHQIKSFRTTVKLQRTFSIRRFIDASGKTRTEKKLVKERRVGDFTRETETTDRSYDSIERHFKSMGVAVDLMRPLRRTPNDQMYWIPNDELFNSRLATSDLNAVQTVALPHVDIAVAGRKSLARAKSFLASNGWLVARTTTRARTSSGELVLVDIGFKFIKAAKSIEVSLLASPGKGSKFIDIGGSVVLPNIVTATAARPASTSSGALETRITVTDFCRIRESGHILIRLTDVADATPSHGNVIDIRGAEGAAELFRFACEDKAT